MERLSVSLQSGPRNESLGDHLRLVATERRSSLRDVAVEAMRNFLAMRGTMSDEGDVQAHVSGKDLSFCFMRDGLYEGLKSEAVGRNVSCRAFVTHALSTTLEHMGATREKLALKRERTYQRMQQQVREMRIKTGQGGATLQADHQEYLTKRELREQYGFTGRFIGSLGQPDTTRPNPAGGAPVNLWRKERVEQWYAEHPHLHDRMRDKSQEHLGREWHSLRMREFPDKLKLAFPRPQGKD